MKRRQSVPLILVLVAVWLAVAACSKTATNSNNTNANTTTNTSRTAATNTTTTNSSTSTTTTTTTADSSPTDVFRAVYDSFRNKDAASFKKMLASSDIKSIDESAKKQGKTVDDFLKELVESPEAAPPATLETRNEKIDGDKATLETKGKNGQWNTIHFVKEGGAWKVLLSGGGGDDKMENMDGHDGSSK